MIGGSSQGAICLQRERVCTSVNTADQCIHLPVIIVTASMSRDWTRDQGAHDRDSGDRSMVSTVVYSHEMAKTES